MPNLTGEVLLPDGGPADAALVTVFSHEEALDYDKSKTMRPPEARTDAAGRFRFSGLAAGDYGLHARRAGGGVGFLPLVRVPEKGAETATVRLVAAVAIEGRVQTEDGLAITGARVTTNAAAPLAALYWQIYHGPFGGRTEIAATTDGDGRFQLAPLGAGTYALDVSAPGRIARKVAAVVAPTRDSIVVLKPAGSIRVVVSIASAALPAEIRVSTSPGTVETDKAPSGPDTTVVLEGVKPGAYVVRATARGFTAAKQPVRVDAAGEAGPVRLVISPGTLVRGRVLEQVTGQALASARVELSYVARTAYGFTFSKEEELTTDAEGRFSARLRPGEWIAEASMRGFAAPDANERNAGHFEVKSEPQEHDLFLIATAAIVGRVEFTDGEPVAGAEVTVEDAEPNPRLVPRVSVRMSSDMQAETDKEGRFRMEGVSTGGRYHLVAEGPAEARGSVEGVVFEEGRNEVEVRFRLERPMDPIETSGRVEGRIVDEAGQPVVGALVLVGDAECATDGEGRFSLERVRSGEMRGQYTAVGHALTFSLPFEVPAGGVLRAPDWTLRRTGIVAQGRITDATGRPVEDAEVWTGFSVAKGTFVHSSIAFTRSDRDGRYRLEGPAFDGAVDCRITVRAEGFQIADKTITLDPMGTADFVLVKDAEILGSAEFRGPAPAWLLCEYFRSDFGTWTPVQTDWDADRGSFTVSRVPPGRLRLRFSAPHFAPGGFQEIDVVAGRSAQARPVVLTAGGTVTGRLLDGLGKPLVGARVFLSDQFLYTDSDALGRFRLEHVPPGTWSFDVYAPEGREGKGVPRFELTVEEGKTTETEQKIGP